MDNGNANIDLLFRNGLRDLEVLPPPGIWNRILPVIRKRQKPFILLRAAAAIAVLVSLGLIVYRWGTEITGRMQESSLAVYDPSLKEAPAGKAAEQVAPVIRTARQPETRSDYATSSPVADGEMIPQAEITNNTGVAYIPGADLLRTENMIKVSGDFSTIRKSSLPIAEVTNNQGGIKEIIYNGKKEKNRRWSVSALASPTYYLNPDMGTGPYGQQIASAEKPRISYSGGVSFSYKVSRKLSIQSGVYYSSFGNEIQGINSFSGFRQYDYTKGDHNFEVLTSNGLIYTDNADVFLLDRSGDRVLTRYTNDVFDPSKANLSYVNNAIYQNFSYLELPVFVKYKLIDRALDFNLFGGLSYNLLVNNTVEAYMSGSKYSIGKTTGLNSFVVSSSLGMGMEYNLTDKISLDLEPTFQYYINPFNTLIGPNSHPFSFGIFSGLSFKF